jgi:drug/metabolite transporter (DMT)-like permease
MTLVKSAWTAYGPTALFVLLWSSGALFAKWGLAHGSAFAFLTLRFALALLVLMLVGAWRRRCLPAPGTRLQVAGTGVLLVGSYSICYLLALDHGLTPGVLATVLGVQPMLTLLLGERRLAAPRLLGLALALGGLCLVVWDSLTQARVSALGMLFAFAALGSMTAGAMLQKRIRQAPADVMPLQYGVSLLLCLACLPFQPHGFEWALGFVLPVVWMALVISVLATLLLYRLIHAGNLVNVTSLFYLVPGGTAALDWLVFGNTMAPTALIGMGAILLGLLQVFRTPRA